jgi:hypothetical protein
VKVGTGGGVEAETSGQRRERLDVPPRTAANHFHATAARLAKLL